MSELVRRAAPEDCAGIARMCAELWPDATAEEHLRELGPAVEGCGKSTLPSAHFVAVVDGAVVGFIEVGLRSHADGCGVEHPVGFLEGWFVEERHRRQGVGAALVRAAEEWARERGCREMASDTWTDHETSQRAHAALGYEEVGRCVHYRKAL